MNDLKYINKRRNQVRCVNEECEFCIEDKGCEVMDEDRTRLQDDCTLYDPAIILHCCNCADFNICNKIVGLPEGSCKDFYRIENQPELS